MTPDDALAIFRRHENKIRSSLFRFFRNVSDVNELAQDVFLRLLETDRQAMKSEEAYTIRIARNVALDARRHLSVVQIDYVPDLHEDGLTLRGYWNDWPDVEDEVGVEQEMELLFAAIEELPETCRMVFVLCRVFDLSAKECADYLGGISVNTIEQHMTKATNRLLVQVGGTKADAVTNVLAYGIGRRAKKASF